MKAFPIFILRGAFCVARFYEQGNARAFRPWNGQQDWLHVFYVHKCRTRLLTRSHQGAWPHIDRMVVTGNSTSIQHIVEYLQQATRNRLVFCHEPIEGLTFVDLGKVLATSLASENLHSPTIAYTAEDVLAEILSSPQNDSQIGNYVALENIGILFEPELEFNLKSIFENASTNRTIVVCSDGTILSDKFYFFQPGDGVFVDMAGLSYMEI